MSLHDKNLEDRLFKKIHKLRREIDRVGPTILRHKLDELATSMHVELRNFDQGEYENKIG